MDEADTCNTHCISVHPQPSSAIRHHLTFPSTFSTRLEFPSNQAILSLVIPLPPLHHSNTPHTVIPSRSCDRNHSSRLAVCPSCHAFSALEKVISYMNVPSSTIPRSLQSKGSASSGGGTAIFQGSAVSGLIRSYQLLGTNRAMALCVALSCTPSL
jgi:hypothetical protein